MPHHGVQVHEDAVAEQIVHFGLASGVLPHEPLGGGGLVRGIVVDVERRIPPPPRDNPVDEPLERRLLLRLVVGPPVVEPGSGLAHGHGAEQVLQSPFRVREPLHVEEDVAVRRRRQQRQPAARLLGHLRPESPTREVEAAGLQLQLCLDPEPVEHGVRHPGHVAAGLAAGQRGQRRDPDLLQPPHLATRHAGDLAQVIGLGEELLGGAGPAAPAPVEAGVRHGVQFPGALEGDE